jgi:drug/metabolite transporter (DMT)-like permease
MVEIVLLIFLCKSIGDVLSKKGRMAIGYQALAVVLWFGGEFAAAILYAVYMVLSGSAMDEIFDIQAYLVAMLGAVTGGGIAFLIAHLIPPAAEPTFEASYGQFQPGQADAGQNPYAGYEETSNLSSAKYMQNYSSNG